MKIVEGDKYVTKQGCLFVVSKYNTAKDILIEFLDDPGAILRVEASQIRRGNIKNPYHRTFLGVGQMGVGPFRSRDEHSEVTLEYHSWSNMLMRCYSEKIKENNPAYKDAIVCEQWHNFQNFALWSQSQIRQPFWHLDKDLILPGNKIYGPGLCVFLPQEINSFLIKPVQSNKTLPVGVCELKNPRNHKKYSAQGQFGLGKTEHLGFFSSVEEAFSTYKARKESRAKALADKYRGQIAPKAVQALENYRVEYDENCGCRR